MSITEAARATAQGEQESNMPDGFYVQKLLDREAAALRGRVAELEDDARDFREDFSQENGSYMCRCLTCEKTFMGHKRRVTCRLCAKALSTKNEGGDVTCATQSTDSRCSPAAAALAELERMTNAQSTVASNAGAPIPTVAPASATPPTDEAWTWDTIDGDVLAKAKQESRKLERELSSALTSLAEKDNLVTIETKLRKGLADRLHQIRCERDDLTQVIKRIGESGLAERNKLRSELAERTRERDEETQADMKELP